MLFEFQRWFAQEHDVVAEGRDLGSVVFPQADIKFFLTAAIHERAHRWQADRAKEGEPFSLDESIAKITARDERDKERAISPLVIPRNAIIIDTTHLTLSETIDKMLNSIHKSRAL
jgi:cytidylate kinase